MIYNVICGKIENQKFGNIAKHALFLGFFPVNNG